MERDIRNKIIVVTGGAQGIGFHIARNFLISEPKLIILLDINEEMGNKAADELTTEFGSNKVVYIKCDVVKDLDETYDKIFKEFGIIDVLINNAGVVDEINAENCVNVTLTAKVSWSLKFMELMRKDADGNGGTIINIGSIYGYRVEYYAPILSAAEFGIVGFTKVAGHMRRYDRKKVRTIAICPGHTRTGLMKDILSGSTDFYLEVRNAYEWQSAEVVGEKAVEVFRIADSGTIWEIEAGVLREVK